MKRIVMNVFLTAFIVLGLTVQSWAFGSRHHGNGQDNGSSQGVNGENQFGNNGQQNPGGNNNQGQGDNNGNNNGNPGPNWQGSPQNQNFPVTPVPEPMTLSLLGTGLAGMYLKRKMR